MDPGSSRRHSQLALALLFGVNFLNYIDRYVIAAVAPLIQRDFGLRDTEMGLVGSMFMVAYMVASPFTGVNRASSLRPPMSVSRTYNWPS